MNYLKSFFITTILLGIGAGCNAQEYQAYTQEAPITTKEPVAESDNIGNSQEKNLIAEDSLKQETTEQEKTALEKWNDHLSLLTAEKGELWDATNNIPNDVWKIEAFRLAKEALDKDISIAESLKSAFRSKLKEKNLQENGNASADAFIDLILEFDKAIDAQLKSIADVETAQQAAKTIVLQETKPESTIELTTTPTEATSAVANEENNGQIEKTEPTRSSGSENLITEWYDLLYKIETEGTTLSDTKKLLADSYELAKQLLSDGLKDPYELQSDLEYALYDRSKNLFAINFNDAMQAFSEAIGVKREQLAYDKQQDQAAYQRRVAIEQELRKQEQQSIEKQMIAQKALDLARERSATQKQESTIQKLQLQYQQKMAQLEARTKAETDAKLAQLREELKTATAPHVPEAPANILGTAIAAFKGAVTTASNWWYGIRKTQDLDVALKEDKDRLKKLSALLDVLAITKNEKNAIKKDWNLFISSLRSAPELTDVTKAEANKQWLETVNKTLETLIMNYHIISLKDASDIIEAIIAPSSNRNRIIKEIKKHLEEKKLKIIYEKQQKEAAILQKAQQKEERKKIALREQQRIKDEKDQKEAEVKRKTLLAASYKNEKNQWKQLLAQLSQKKQATREENNSQTREAIKKSQSLLNLASQIPSKNKPAISQKLKQNFTVALLDQQKLHNNTINIHQNMEQFNKAINKMVE